MRKIKYGCTHRKVVLNLISCRLLLDTTIQIDKGLELKFPQRPSRLRACIFRIYRYFRVFLANSWICPPLWETRIYSDFRVRPILIRTYKDIFEKKIQDSLPFLSYDLLKSCKDICFVNPENTVLIPFARFFNSLEDNRDWSRFFFRLSRVDCVHTVSFYVNSLFFAPHFYLTY